MGVERGGRVVGKRRKRVNITLTPKALARGREQANSLDLSLSQYIERYFTKGRVIK